MFLCVYVYNLEAKIHDNIYFSFPFEPAATKAINLICVCARLCNMHNTSEMYTDVFKTKYRCLRGEHVNKLYRQRQPLWRTKTIFLLFLLHRNFCWFFFFFALMCFRYYVLELSWVFNVLSNFICVIRSCLPSLCLWITAIFETNICMALSRTLSEDSVHLSFIAAREALTQQITHTV